MASTEELASNKKVADEQICTDQTAFKTIDSHPTAQALRVMHAKRYIHQYRGFCDEETARKLNCTIENISRKDPYLSEDILKPWLAKLDEQLSKEEFRRGVWHNLKRQGVFVGDGDAIPEDHKAMTRHVWTVACQLGDTHWLMLRRCMAEYVKEDQRDLASYQGLIAERQYATLKQRVDNDEAMLKARLGPMMESLEKPLRRMIRKMRIRYKLDQSVMNAPTEFVFESERREQEVPLVQ